MSDETKNNLIVPASAGLSRRALIRGGATLAAAGAIGGLTGFPVTQQPRAWAQDANTLNFWQFYAPGGDVKTQVDWFEKMVDDWNSRATTRGRSSITSSTTTT